MLTRTEIAWVKNPSDKQGYGANPIRGKCKHNCDYCYAERQRKRLNQPAKISWHSNVLTDIEKLKRPATIFIGSMYDIFGAWIDSEWIETIFETVARCPQHTFLFLTKNPDRYFLFENIPNVWLGATVSIANHADPFSGTLQMIPHENIFISTEPLLQDIAEYIDYDGIKWIIIGTLNKSGRPVHADKGGTKLEWIINLTNQAIKHGIPIFMKNECYVLYPELTGMFGQLKALPYLENKK